MAKIKNAPNRTGEKNGKSGLVLVSLGSACTFLYKMYRRNRQKNLQQKVNASQPASVSKNLTVDEPVIDDQTIDLSKYQKVKMRDEEVDEWKTVISSFVGNTAEVVLDVSAFSGLLKCDVPIKELCRIKNNPNAMRGMIIKDGKIKKQATFSEVGLGNMPPLLVYQCLAALTSQYYQQIITSRLATIDLKIDEVINHILAKDRGTLKTYSRKFAELCQKSKFDNEDKLSILVYSKDVEVLREKYREILSTIHPIDISDKPTAAKETEEKIRKIDESRYVEYLEIATCAESLAHIATVISIKIAQSLGKYEDVDIYLKRMNFDYWNNYVDQFVRIKHDVLKYIELEEKKAIIKRDSIKKMHEVQCERFKKVEESMLQHKRLFDLQIVQYIKVTENGQLEKYISVEM